MIPDAPSDLELKWILIGTLCCDTEESFVLLFIYKAWNLLCVIFKIDTDYLKVCLTSETVITAIMR